MKIKELMALELFKSCKLLTNEIGLENEVDSAMVLEALDIETWAKRNQLILTSFYAFKDLPMDELQLFFKKMKQLGISGLLIKMDRLITIIPDWLIELCFTYQLPLIKVEQDISYEKILLTIYEPLLNHQSRLLRTYYDVRQRFTKVERNHHSFTKIMETFYQLIDSPCSLKIPILGVNIQLGPVFDEDTVLEKTYIETNELTKNAYQRWRFVSEDGRHQQVAIVSEIMTSFAKTATLTVYLQKETLEESQMMILENVIDIIYEQLQTEYLLKKERYTRLNNLADAILQNTPTSLDELNSLLDDAQMNHYPYYQGIAFSAKQQGSQQIEKKLLKDISGLRTHKIFFEHYHYTVVLFNLPERQQEIHKKEIQTLFDIHAYQDFELTISMSRVKEKNGLKEVLLECLDAIRFNQLMQIDPIVSINELGIFRHFMRENRLAELEESIPTALIQLFKDQPELFDTLFAFFQSGRNYKKTAEKLFLHSKTIRYRLNKIEQLLQVDLTNPLQLVNHEIGTYLLKAKRNE